LKRSAALGAASLQFRCAACRGLVWLWRRRATKGLAEIHDVNLSCVPAGPLSFRLVIAVVAKNRSSVGPESITSNSPVNSPALEEPYRQKREKGRRKCRPLSHIRSGFRGGFRGSLFSEFLRREKRKSSRRAKKSTCAGMAVFVDRSNQGQEGGEKNRTFRMAGRSGNVLEKSFSSQREGFRGGTGFSLWGLVGIPDFLPQLTPHRLQPAPPKSPLVTLEGGLLGGA
jgi:hypothetical protein